MVDENAGPGAETADGSLSQEDRQILAGVERAIASARELKGWWQGIDAAGAYEDRFDVGATHHGPEESFGFFGEAEVSATTMPVMGTVQRQLYDRPKAAGSSAAARRKAASWINRQMREFVLHYFMRVSAFSQPEAFPGKNGRPPPSYLRPFSWYPREDGAGLGFGFEQVYYKLAGRDKPQKFAEEDRYAIVDLRQIGETYEWIVLKVDLFSFQFVLAPFGQNQPYGAVPWTEPSYLVLSKDFIVDEEDSEDRDDLGRYGFGSAFLPAAEEGLLAQGLGRFEAAFQEIRFDVGESGEVASRIAFVASRPRKVVSVSVDPVDWGLRLADAFSLGTASAVIEPMQKLWNRVPGPGGVDPVQAFITAANMITSGGAARSLGVSRKQLHKSFLVAQFQQHYNAIAGSLMVWRQVPDWLDRPALRQNQEWVVSGRTAGSNGGVSCDEREW